MVTQEQISSILKNIENHKSYYAGGSLCVDDVNGDILIMNLNEEFFFFNGGLHRLLSIENVRLLYQLYEKYKGKTEHYFDNLKNSVARHY